jgi:hypothetical protein
MSLTPIDCVVPVSGKTEPASISFVIPTCVRTARHALALVNCLRSVRRFHGDAPITVVCDGVPCADGAADVEQAKALATSWVPNPFPASGEFGAVYIAAHLPIPAQRAHVALVHDSTALMRPIVGRDLSGTGNGWMPCWYAGPEHISHSPCDDFVRIIIRETACDDLKDAWLRAISDPRRMYVAFGCMGIGSPEAWRLIWNAGLEHVSAHVLCRNDRCIIERLLAMAACVARVCPDKPRHKATESLCGDIFRHPRAWRENIIHAWDSNEQPDDKPAMWKTWFGR